jgi:hypothetical protein
LLALCCLALLLALTSASAEAETDDATSSEEPDSHSVLRTGQRLSPKFSLHGFADTTFLLQEAASPDDESEAGFYIGELDLYMVSQLSPRWSFLGELVFEYEREGETVADVERVFIKYSVSDLLWTSVGRRHTPLGYWNETYHHGLFLQPTVERPLVLRFEDRDGVLPIHSVGLDVGGSNFIGPWSLDYRGGVYNGRGPTRLDVQSFGDANVNKATLLKLSSSRQRDDYLRFGLMVYRDEIPPNPDALEPHTEMDERIYGLHFIYERPQFEFLSEFYEIHHREPSVSEEWTHHGYYGLFIWQRWAWRPYLGYEVLELQEGDPYYVGVPTNWKRALAGVRFDPIPFLGLKLELRRDDFTVTDVDGLAIQVAYTF